MSVITSRKNPLIQDLRALAQSPARRTARCLVEGWRFIAAASAAGARVQLVVQTPAAAADPRGEEIRRRLQTAGVRSVLVSPYVFESLTQVDAPQGVLGIVRRPADASPEILLQANALLAVLDGVQDPGNVGAILRTAVAAGATGAVIVGAAADPYGPKAIRAAAGAVFHLPLVFFRKASEAAAALRAHGLRLLLADPKGGHLHTGVSYARPLALIFGSEGAGPQTSWREHATTVRLPMAEAVESLGVSAAAAILLYAAAQTSAPLAE